MTPQNPTMSRRPRSRCRGVAAILAMMFLVIFSSLAAAMAIVAQGNLTTADTSLKINRSIAAAETGLHFVIFRLDEASKDVTTSAGYIYDPSSPDYDPDLVHPDGNAVVLWQRVRTELLDSLASDLQYQSSTFFIGEDESLTIPELTVAPGEPRFSVKLTPHPLPGDVTQYNAARYKRPPYSQLTPAVSSSNPLDATWVRVVVTAIDGPSSSEVSRSISMDFRLDKKTRYAILSKSRVMIGKNVLIDGPVGSRFLDTHLTNGHPIQMVSDFRGMNAELDAKLDALMGSLVGGTIDPVTGINHHDIDGDNRLQLHNPVETGNLDDPSTPQDEAAALDINGDGYIDDFDFFLGHFGRFDAGTGLVRVSGSDLESGGLSAVDAAQLVELIDTFGSPTRAGYGDGVIDAQDAYAKLRGEIHVSAARSDWEAGAADGPYQPMLQGAISPSHKKDPITFESEQNNAFSFGPGDFNVQYFKNRATGDLEAQALTQASTNPGGTDPDGPQPLGQEVTESVPFAAAHPYDYYTRPVYKNMTFSNVRIPRGTNALFKNCRFIGVTYVESEATIVAGQRDYNYAGMQEHDGTPKHPDRYVLANPSLPDEEANRIYDTKAISNNLRFEDCIFEGGIVTDAPNEFAHVRNKIAFTGTTRFQIDDSPNLSNSDKRLFKRSTILAPHYSVELGTFIAPHDAKETVHLSGTIVAGVLDMRGQVKVNGSIVTTFEPKVDEGPVTGETSPQFNTTLGYFSSEQGDLEAEYPETGLGVIQVKFDPTIPMPDGISGPVELAPQWGTYYEGQ